MVRLTSLAWVLAGLFCATGTPAHAAPTANQGESLERLFLNELRAKLAADDFFKDLRVQMVDDQAPLALLSQNPPSQKNRTFYLPWMHRLSENLVGRFLQPLGLTRRTANPVTPVIVLANDASLAKYWEARTGTEEVLAASTLDPALRSVVTSESGNAAWLRRQPVLRDLTLGILTAYSASGAEDQDFWFRRGFACYVSYHTGTRKEVLDTYTPNRYAVRLLFDLLRQKKRHEALWIPLQNLMEVESLADLDPKARGVEPSLRSVFDDTASIWLHFFNHAEDGKYRDGASAFLKRTLAGEGGLAAFKECFGTDDLASLEREFESYVYALFDRIFVEPTRTPDPEAEALAEEVLPPIDLASLRGRPTEVAEGLGMALWGAQQGRLSDSIALLETLAPTLDPEGAALVEFELVRLRTLREARDRYFADAVQEGSKVRLTWKGEKVNEAPTGLEEGVLQFVTEESSRSIPLDELDSVSLVLCMGTPPEELGAGWLRSYGFALAEDARWKRFLRDRGPQGERLAKDAELNMPAWLAAGRTLGALAELAGGGVPETPEQAVKVLERVSALLELAGPGAPDSQRTRINGHRALLSTLAQRALCLRYLEDGVQQALNGEIEALPGGRLRIAYDFSDSDQFDDFVEVPGYLQWRHEQLRGTPSQKGFKIEKKSLRGTGVHCFRHRLKFGAPMSVAYEFEFDKKTSEEGDLAEVMLAICDDTEGSYLACYAQGELQIEQRRLKTVDIIGRDEEPSSYLIGHPHFMGLRHDGELVSTWRDDEKRQESPCLGLTSGHIFLWVALSGILSFDNIVIEGVPDPVGLRQLRDTWVGEQLEAMGLAVSEGSDE